MRKTNRIVFGISMLLTLGVLWFLLSGHTEPLLIGLGTFSVLFVLWLSVRMRVLDEEGLPVYVHELALARYVVWLAVEVVKSNLAVTRMVFRRDLQLDAVTVRLPARQHTVIGRVIYANSITLTPGTVSIDLDDESVEVHALDRAAAEELARGEMHDRVCEVEVVPRV